MRVVVGLSGGVDSSVVALLLLQAGHDVTGITMCIRQRGRYSGALHHACFSPAATGDADAAAALCQQLGIPFHVYDCADDYEREILDYFRREYLAGRTPNPCVACNAAIKFGVLPELARQSGLSFDRFATGHYARIEERAGRSQLLRARDHSKDQSYFLYRLNQQQLARHLFPLGNLTKEEVRAIAAAAGLQAAAKRDSQDFYRGDYSELLGEPDRPGEIVDHQGGLLGHHSGFWKYTVGQRKGLGIAHPEPLYVTALDAVNNRVVVGTATDALCHTLLAEACNWVSIEPPQEEIEVELKVRSAGTPHAGVVVRPAAAGCYEARFPQGIAGVAPGQSAVFYRGDLLLGGGIIRESR